MAIGPFTVGDRPTSSLAIDVTQAGTSISLGDYSAATAILTYPSGAQAEVDAYIQDDDVIVAWPEDTTAFTEAGAYVLSVTLTGPVNSTAITPLGFTVHASTAQAWASVGDVQSLTGKSVTPDQIVQAQATVEMVARVYSGTTYLHGQTAADGQTIGLAANDSQLLRMAVAYQAAWVAAQPGLYDRADVTSLGQDGVSANYAGNGLILSPHAKQAIKRLSWMGSRSVTTRNARATYSLVDALDDALPWRPLR